MGFLMSVNPKYSDYFSQLDESAKLRYSEKLNSIGLQVDDPYTYTTSRESFTETDTVPNIEYPDIYNFFINSPSPYTKEELKAYKSLDGYKYLLAGWVSNMCIHPVANDDD